MTVRLKGNSLHLRMTAARTAIPQLIKYDCAEAEAKTQMPQRCVPASADVHFLTACRAARIHAPFQFAMKQADLTTRSRLFQGSLGVAKAG